MKGLRRNSGLTTAIVSIVVVLILPACDSSDEEAPTLEGRWRNTLGSLTAAAGDCCGLEILLLDEEGRITGSGTLSTPSDRIGMWYEHAVDITGTFTGRRVTLNLRSGIRSGQYNATYYPDRGIGGRGGIEGSFTGFGYRADSLFLNNLEDN